MHMVYMYYETLIENIYKGLSDWYAKQWELQENAATKISDSFNLRNHGRIIRSETRVKTEWDTYINNARLADRVRELSRWKELLGQLSNKLTLEIQLLKTEKADSEKEIEILHFPLHITAECISMRDCRRGNELTHDEADIELKKELCTIENIKLLLTNRAQAAWEKINRLEEVKFKMNLDLEDKTETIEIDKKNLNLDHTCANISCKINALRIPKQAVSYETWLEHCQNLKILSDNELSDTYHFREAMHVMRERAKNDISAQQDVTNFTLRKRIYQTQKARNEMEWQKYKVHREIEALQKETITLIKTLTEKNNAIKCAETRLENRIYRPRFELCQDEVELGLKNEALQLRQTEKNLLEAIENTKASCNSLQSMLMRIDKNLDDKQHSLSTDIMCLDMRAPLKIEDKTRLSNETDRNIALTHMEKELPTEY